MPSLVRTWGRLIRNLSFFTRRTDYFSGRVTLSRAPPPSTRRRDFFFLLCQRVRHPARSCQAWDRMIRLCRANQLIKVTGLMIHCTTSRIGNPSKPRNRCHVEKASNGRRYTSGSGMKYRVYRLTCCRLKHPSGHGIYCILSETEKGVSNMDEWTRSSAHCKCPFVGSDCFFPCL